MPGRDGPVIPRDSHVRIVHPAKNDGARMLRRGYNFVDGTDALGGLDAGLFFLATSAIPAPTSSPCRTAWRQQDELMEYLKFTGSASSRCRRASAGGSTSARRSSPESRQVRQPGPLGASGTASYGTAGPLRFIGIISPLVIGGRAP